jgi:hypothetical protein
MVDLALLQELRDALNAALRGAKGNQWDTGGADWLTRSREACPDDLMKQIVADNRGGPSTYSSPLPKPKATSQQSEAPQKPYTHGWVDPPKIRPPDGVSICDAMMDQQDRRDAIARAHEMGLSYAEWQKLSEQDLKDRQAQKEKADKARKETPK